MLCKYLLISQFIVLRIIEVAREIRTARRSGKSGMTLRGVRRPGIDDAMRVIHRVIILCTSAPVPRPRTRISLICVENAEGRPEEALSAPKCRSNERKLLFTRDSCAALSLENVSLESLRGNNRISTLITAAEGRSYRAISGEAQFIRASGRPVFQGCIRSGCTVALSITARRREVCVRRRLICERSSPKSLIVQRGKITPRRFARR